LQKNSSACETWLEKLFNEQTMGSQKIFIHKGVKVI